MAPASDRDRVKLVGVGDGYFWHQEFEQMRSCLLDATEGRLTNVVHVGSTAVQELVARPIVDLLAGISSAREMDAVEPYIIGLNFRRVAAPVEDSRVRLFRRPRGGEETHHVYLVEQDTPFWDAALKLRDLLRGCGGQRSRFGSYKMHLAQTFADDATAYAEAKTPFLRSVLR